MGDRSASYAAGGPVQTAHSYGDDDLAGLDGGRGKVPKNTPLANRKNAPTEEPSSQLPPSDGE